MCTSPFLLSRFDLCDLFHLGYRLFLTSFRVSVGIFFFFFYFVFSFIVDTFSFFFPRLLCFVISVQRSNSIGRIRQRGEVG